MTKASTNEIKRGQALSFRVPSDTPEHILKQLQRLKTTERRNFSSKIAEFVIQGVSQSYSREKETLTIPLPQKLTKAQRDWLKHEHSEAMLGSIIYQLISDPVRATSLFTSLNSQSVDIEEALYLQENLFPAQLPKVDDGLQEMAAAVEQVIPVPIETGKIDDDLNEFNWEDVRRPEETDAGESDDEEDVDDLLGGFLASMNK
jgi:hypothetical protein